MPKYDWKCASCSQVVEVIRRMANSAVGPSCRCTCGAEDWKRVFHAPMSTVAKDDGYPFTWRSGQKLVRDVHGDPIPDKNHPGRFLKREDRIEFKTRAEHESWMKDNGYVFSRDLDETIGQEKVKYLENPPPGYTGPRTLREDDLLEIVKEQTNVR